MHNQDEVDQSSLSREIKASFSLDMMLLDPTPLVSLSLAPLAAFPFLSFPFANITLSAVSSSSSLSIPHVSAPGNSPVRDSTSRVYLYSSLKLKRFHLGGMIRGFPKLAKLEDQAASSFEVDPSKVLKAVTRKDFFSNFFFTGSSLASICKLKMPTFDFSCR